MTIRGLGLGVMFLVAASLLSYAVIPAWGTTGTLNIVATTTLTEDHSGNIIIDTNGITLDCAGHSVTGTGSGAGILLNGKTGVTVVNCNITNFSDGILLSSSSSNTLQGNTVDGNTDGIEILNSNNNQVEQNDASGNIVAYKVVGGHHNVLNGNNAIGNQVGYDLFDSRDNSFTGNLASGNLNVGFLLNAPSASVLGDNTFSENTVTGNGIGFNLLLLAPSTGNIIFHNNIIGNTVQALDVNPAGNNWHHPGLLEGNFWSDYPGADDGSGSGKHTISGDGIGDTSIPWPAADFDNYPFVRESGWEPVFGVPEFDVSIILLMAPLAAVLLLVRKLRRNPPSSLGTSPSQP